MLDSCCSLAPPNEPGGSRDLWQSAVEIWHSALWPAILQASLRGPLTWSETISRGSQQRAEEETNLGWPKQNLGWSSGKVWVTQWKTRR